MARNQISKKHVALWQKSGMSRAAYCRGNNIPYSRFLKLCKEHADTGEGRFIPIAPEPKGASIEVRFPNGITLFCDNVDINGLVNALRDV